MSIYDNLEFKHLKAILAITDAGTFTAASEQLHVAQSALSRQISELEDALSIQIFERGPSGTHLTPAGESLSKFARQYLQARKELVDVVLAMHQARLRPFHLGFTPFIEPNVISTVCEVYRELFPRAEVHPETEETEDILDKLKAKELDAALVTLPMVPDGYAMQAIMHEPLVVCLRKDDPLANLEEVPAKALDGRLAIFSDPRHHPRAHARLLELLEERGIRPGLSKPTFNNEHVQWMVRERICVALVRESESLHDDLTTRPIEGVHWTIDSALIYLQDHQQSALPLLLRELEKRFSISEPIAAKKPPQNVAAGPKQRQLRFG